MKNELHLIILWDENNIHEVEDTIRERFQIVKKLRIPPLGEVRVDVLNIIYRFELPVEELMSVSKGTRPTIVFVVIDENPVYELKQTSRQLKHFNINLFNLKRELRKGRSNYLHTTDNIEETHDNLKIFSEVTGDSSIYDEWNKWRLTFPIKIWMKNDIIDFNGDRYQSVGKWDIYSKGTEGEVDISTKDRYYFTGKFCRFLGSKDKDYGYKIFTSELDINLLFDIQNILSNGGFAPHPYEIMKCCDDTQEYFAIKMDNIRGIHVQPDKKWINSLVDFCNENKIYRHKSTIAKKRGWRATIEEECVPKNCIKTDDGKIYLVDIDQRYRYEKSFSYVSK